MRRKGRNWIWVLFRLLLILGLSFLIVSPLLFKLSDALKSTADSVDPTIFLIPKHPTTQHFRVILQYMNYVPSFINSLLLVLGESILQLLSCSVVAYGLGRFHFRLQKVVFGCVLLTLIVPVQTILLPLYLQFGYFSPETFFAISPSFQGNYLDLLNTYWPFFLLSISALGLKNALYIFMLRQSFRNIPDVLEEAAYIDGCGMFKTFYCIALPMVRTVLMTVFLFAFVWQWNDSVYPTFFAQRMDLLGSKMYGIGYSIAVSMGQTGNNYLMSVYNNAAIILHIIPLIILYVFTQRFFVQSIERSGIVG